MRRIKRIVMIALSLCCMCIQAVASTEPINMYLNGEYVGLENEGIYIDQGTTMVPLRFVSETLGVYVNYDVRHKTIHLSTLEYNGSDHIVEGYMLGIDLIYNRDTGLNDNITYIAIDTTQMRYLSEEDKERLLKEMECYGVVVEATYNELEQQGLIQEGTVINGILITINDLCSEDNHLVLDIEKWKSRLGSIGCEGMVLGENENGWEVIEKGMWYIS